MRGKGTSSGSAPASKGGRPTAARSRGASARGTPATVTAEARGSLAGSSSRGPDRVAWADEPAPDHDAEMGDPHPEVEDEEEDEEDKAIEAEMEDRMYAEEVHSWLRKKARRATTTGRTRHVDLKRASKDLRNVGCQAEPAELHTTRESALWLAEKVEDLYDQLEKQRDQRSELQDRLEQALESHEGRARERSRSERADRREERRRERDRRRRTTTSSGEEDEEVNTPRLPVSPVRGPRSSAMDDYAEGGDPSQGVRLRSVGAVRREQQQQQ